MTHPRFFQIRDAVSDDAVNIAKVHIQCWNESYKGIIESNYLNSISFDTRLQQRKNTLSNQSDDYRNLVACNEEGGIIGFCDFGMIRNRKSDAAGEIYAIYILKEYQRMGVGSALWNESVIYLKAHGLTPFVVTVLEQNWTARSFYEKQKGSVLSSNVIALGSQQYKEICYIFDIDYTT